jgi:hypothetical protein
LLIFKRRLQKSTSLRPIFIMSRFCDDSLHSELQSFRTSRIREIRIPFSFFSWKLCFIWFWFVLCFDTVDLALTESSLDPSRFTTMST